MRNFKEKKYLKKYDLQQVWKCINKILLQIWVLNSSVDPSSPSLTLTTKSSSICRFLLPLWVASLLSGPPPFDIPYLLESGTG